MIYLLKKKMVDVLEKIRENSIKRNTIYCPERRWEK